jgi:hypothetical protein
MQVPHKKLLRPALRIHQRLTQQPQEATPMDLPVNAWSNIDRLADQIRRAKQHGWQRAAARCSEDLSRQLVRLRDETNALLDRLATCPTQPTVLSAQDIYRDLVGLHDEFPSIDWNLRQAMLSVTTEPITLQQVDLGPFEIRLDWRNLKDSDAYRVLALDPNPAAFNSSVTQPHVQDEARSEGKSRQPIRQALRQGRLLDFFLIVAGLLRTYNPHSPFVSLSDWQGADCADCGAMVRGEDRYSCEKCETAICGNCYARCAACDGSFCSECISRCDGCEELHCRACLKHCSSRDAEVCQKCLDQLERYQTRDEKLTQ